MEYTGNRRVADIVIDWALCEGVLSREIYHHRTVHQALPAMAVALPLPL